MRSTSVEGKAGGVVFALAVLISILGPQAPAFLLVSAYPSSGDGEGSLPKGLGQIDRIISGGLFMARALHSGRESLGQVLAPASPWRGAGQDPAYVAQAVRGSQDLGAVLGPNIRVSRDSPHYYPFENEPSIAANPRDPLNMVVASHDYGDPNYLVGIAVYRTRDGGRTWQGPVRMIPTYGDSLSDPVLAAGRDGAFYLAYLSIGAYSEISLAISRDGGESWTFKRVLRYNYTAFYDKPWIAVGPNPLAPSRDAIYITYTEFRGSFFTGYNLSIKLMRSFDGGLTFEGPFRVSWEGRDNETVVQWSYPVVAPDGTLYVSFYGLRIVGNKVVQGMWIVRSTDGGSTFSEPVLAAETSWWFPGYSGVFGFRWIVPTPATAVGPDGSIYIAYEDSPGGPEGLDMADIFFVSSRDGGLTWSRPVRVNDDKTHAAQFFPAIAVGRDGTIHIIWGDKRLDPDGPGYDIYYTYSRDGGRSFAKNVRVSDITSNAWLGIPFFIGDYFSLTAVDSGVYVVWTDSRRGSAEFVPGAYQSSALNQDIFIAFAAPRNGSSLEVQPRAVESGLPQLVGIRARGLPSEARLAVALNGSLLPVRVIAGGEGFLEAWIQLPAMMEGRARLSLVDPTSMLEVASAEITIYPSTIYQRLSSQIEAGFSNTSALLGALGARIVSVENTLALINTSLGLVYVDLRSLNATITRLRGDVADLATALGNVSARLENLGARIVDLNGSVALIRTSVGDIVGRVISLQGGVATISTSLGEARVAIDQNTQLAASISSRIDRIEGTYLPLLLALQAASAAALAAIAFLMRSGGR